MTVHEASHLWFFESHNSSKRSQWLRSTLSELEEKTKGMLKLIEGDADTFAQRAEMYYKKRPELVNMIEDFYRSYRSLAERYDQLKLESANRGLSLKEWSFIDKPSASSSLIFDSESEVDDPSEEEQVESKLREVGGSKNFNDILMMGIKRERSDLLTYSFNSELSEVNYPELEETQVEFKLEESPERKSEICVVKPMIETQVEFKLEESPERKSDIYVVKPMMEKIESTKVKSRNAADQCFEQSKYLYGETNNVQDENNPLAESIISKKTEIYVVKPMMEKAGSTNAADKCFAQFESLNHKPNEGRDEYNSSEISEKKGDYLSHPLAETVKSQIENFEEISGLSFENWEVLNYEREEAPCGSNLKEAQEEKADNDAKKLMKEVERLKGENMNFKVELERKDEEKREAIRQLSLSVDLLKGENDSMKRFIRDSKNQSNLFRKLKGVFSKKLFGGNQSKFPTTLVAL